MNSPPGSDLRLMSWGDGSGVPTSVNNLVIVGADNTGLLHIRIFDAGGNLVTDTDETKLPSTQAAAISTLKQLLPGLLPPHVLTGAEKAQVITEVTSIVGQTRPPSRTARSIGRGAPTPTSGTLGGFLRCPTSGRIYLVKLRRRLRCGGRWSLYACPREWSSRHQGGHSRLLSNTSASRAWTILQRRRHARCGSARRRLG